MKNICIVSECQQILGIGGTETVSFLLKEELKKNGYYVWSAFFVPKAQMTEKDLLFPNGLEDIISTENLDFFINIINTHRINTILLQGTTNDHILNLAIEAKKKTRVKLIYTNHFNPLMSVKEYDDYKDRCINSINSPIKKFITNIYLEIKRLCYLYKSIKSTKDKYGNYDINNIDKFISLNKQHTKFLQSLYHTNYKNKFHTIANPIVLDDKEYLFNKENIILFVGRLTYQKRLDRLLFIWKDIQKKFQDWKVIVVGNGEYANEYRRISKEIELKNIEFVGQQPSEEYFKRSKIICMTSSHESFGMVLVEGQKYGCVPIAYNSFESATDIIQNGHNGLLVSPFKEKEYRKAISKLASNENYRKELALNGVTFIEKFDIKTIIREWINLLDNI